MKIQFRLIQIGVSDPQKARSFYMDTLGFEEAIENSSDSVPALKTAHGIPILLYPAKELKQLPYPDHNGVILVIEVDDIYKTYETWKSRGVEFIPIEWSKDETGIANCPFGKFIAFQDPDGNVHEILEPHKT